MHVRRRYMWKISEEMAINRIGKPQVGAKIVLFSEIKQF